jgi:hypothetical protein
MQQPTMKPLNIAVIGAGGLGRGMAAMLTQRQGLQVVGLVDSNGYAYEANGLLPLNALQGLPTVAQLPAVGVPCPVEPILTFLKTHGASLDGLFLALPNLPVNFYAETITAILEQTPFKGVIVDALKRVKAVEALMPLQEALKAKGVLYITGAGATPGFLTTIAAVAAQSFVSVEAVDIRFGVGVACWEQYKATVREDLLQLPEFTPEQVAAMSDADVEAELDKRHGLLELEDMEHADALLLEWAGVCARDKVKVGGVVNTRSAEKPITTTVTITGKTLLGATTQHTFEVSNHTTMVDNVCGPACGFLLRGSELYQQGLRGLHSSVSIMPAYSPALALNLAPVAVTV